jgi:hypothetical protein
LPQPDAARSQIIKGEDIVLPYILHHPSYLISEHRSSSPLISLKLIKHNMSRIGSGNSSPERKRKLRQIMTS